MGPYIIFCELQEYSLNRFFPVFDNADAAADWRRRQRQGTDAGRYRTTIGYRTFGALT